ncbi:MAG: hypothetical protein IJ160_02260 [Muribaculaceae bacterium]|nr:hypothetical protein [Muribaculaceae bacterium]
MLSLVLCHAVYGDTESAPVSDDATVPEPVSYGININQTGEGTIDCPETAVEGENVIFTVTPNDGETYDLVITDVQGNEITYNAMRAADTYSFVMPASRVNIDLTFHNIGTGVSNVNAGKAIATVRYYNMAGQVMRQPSGATIVVTTYTDGTTSTVKVMK